VIRSASTDESAALIREVAKHLGEAFAQSTASLPRLSACLAHMERLKELLAKQQLLPRMLCQVFGISNSLADAVLQKYPTLSEIVAASETLHEEGTTRQQQRALAILGMFLSCDNVNSL
jgi:ERCC4-type nuclease